MIVAASAYSKPSPWQVSLGAEGIAAAQFARCGFDVSIQSGRDKPSYDLVVAKSGYLLKVCVRGSDDGSWALTQAYLKRAADLSGKRANCQGAIDLWLDHHGSRTVCCLVQFHVVSMDELPRIYLASPYEVAQKLRETADRLETPTLYERYEWTPRGEVSSFIEMLPSNWEFSERRIQDLLVIGNKGTAMPASIPKRDSPISVWPIAVDSTRIPQRAIGLSA